MGTGHKPKSNHKNVHKSITGYYWADLIIKWAKSMEEKNNMNGGG